MRIVVANSKGGTGKTTLAYNLAKDLDFFLISNDDSVIETVYPKMSKIMQEPALLTDDIDVVYDFGGFVDTNILKIVKKSDIIIIPLTDDANSLKKTIIFTDEIKKYNKNIFFALNRYIEKENDDFFDIIKLLRKKYSKSSIFILEESKIWKNSFRKKKSVLELKNTSKFYKYIYRNVLNDYEILIDELKEIKEKKEKKIKDLEKMLDEKIEKIIKKVLEKKGVKI